MRTSQRIQGLQNAAKTQARLLADLKEGPGLLGADIEVPVEERQEVQAEDARSSNWDLSCRQRGRGQTLIRSSHNHGRRNCSEETSSF